MSTATDRLQRAYDNYTYLLVLVTETIANPTREGVDAVLSAATTSNIMQPKLTYSVDGESWDWIGYQNFITNQLLVLEKAIQRSTAPFEIRTTGRS